MSGRRIFLLLLGILLLFAYLMVVLVRGDEGPPKSGIRAERVNGRPEKVEKVEKRRISTGAQRSSPAQVAPFETNRPARIFLRDAISD